MLDLFAGAGGAARGYQRAGFYVVGVDLKSQPRYAGDEFHQADAMTFDLVGYDAIHASPPCQRFSVASRCRPGLADEYPDLIAAVRDRLVAAGVPYAIENVPGSPLEAPTLLCGQMFGLDLFRHRMFESSVPLPFTLHSHAKVGSKAGGSSYKGGWQPGRIISVAGNCAPIAEARRAMGIDWMQGRELAEAIPPAYTEWVGRRLLEALAAAPA